MTILKNTLKIFHIIVIYLYIHEKVFPSDCVTSYITIGYLRVVVNKEVTQAHHLLDLAKLNPH